MPCAMFWKTNLFVYYDHPRFWSWSPFPCNFSTITLYCACNSLVFIFLCDGIYHYSFNRVWKSVHFTNALPVVVLLIWYYSTWKYKDICRPGKTNRMEKPYETWKHCRCAVASMKESSFEFPAHEILIDTWMLTLGRDLVEWWHCTDGIACVCAGSKQPRWNSIEGEYPWIESLH